ncbi:MAG: DUF4428 domain-containing protein [Lachnospiraceae bacterium]|nr:DUF4428 domain-containing protein [Lachnospiraceae bacterium]
MAFFGLFDKKICAICGGEIGLLGNRKLEDGNCCKNCAAKLSPWFDERRHSTVEQIKEQLAYREENLKAVENFHTTRTIACDRWNVLLDEDARKFILTRDPRKITETNPDVISFSDITGCRVDVDEDRTEEKREVKNGDRTEYVSYNPPRYTYRYNFKYIINVNNPYFDEMKFDLNNSRVEIDSAAGAGFSTDPKAGLLGNILNAAAGAGAALQAANPHLNPEYAKYEKIGEDITAALTGAQDIVREEKEAASAGPKIAICPFCGAQTEVTADGKCEYCGGYIAEQV